MSSKSLPPDADFELFSSENLKNLSADKRRFAQEYDHEPGPTMRPKARRNFRAPQGNLSEILQLGLELALSVMPKLHTTTCPREIQFQMKNIL